MRKKIIALVITLLAVFSLNVVVYGDPTNGIVPLRPISAPLCPPPVCPEDCQGEDDDN